MSMEMNNAGRSKNSSIKEENVILQSALNECRENLINIKRNTTRFLRLLSAIVIGQTLMIVLLASVSLAFIPSFKNVPNVTNNKTNEMMVVAEKWWQNHSQVCNSSMNNLQKLVNQLQDNFNKTIENLKMTVATNSQCNSQCLSPTNSQCEPLYEIFTNRSSYPLFTSSYGPKFVSALPNKYGFYPSINWTNETSNLWNTFVTNREHKAYFMLPPLMFPELWENCTIEPWLWWNKGYLAYSGCIENCKRKELTVSLSVELSFYCHRFYTKQIVWLKDRCVTDDNPSWTVTDNKTITNKWPMPEVRMQVLP